MSAYTTVYSFDHISREYLGTTRAYADPKQPGRYAMPANCREEAPPETPVGYVACATDFGWEVVEDRRGERYWLPGDDWDHEGRVMVELGPLPGGATLAKPEMPEDVRLTQAAETIRAERDRRLTACDYLMMPDYPLSEEQKTAWAAYRQALRDLPEQEGFPWGGADDPAVVWPVVPGGG